MAQAVKNSTAMQETQVPSLVGKIPCRRDLQSTPVFLPRESHGPRSLAGYSPWGSEELDMTKQLTYIQQINHGSNCCYIIYVVSCIWYIYVSPIWRLIESIFWKYVVPDSPSMSKQFLAYVYVCVYVCMCVCVCVCVCVSHSSEVM